jgi:uncharacterized membrane protein
MTIFLKLNKTRLLTGFLLAATVALVVGWLIETPAGLLGKMDAIGYAICHRIAARSFDIGDRALPLCARCTGMYLGALIGLAYQARLGKRGGLPSRKILAVLAFFLVAFGLDGVNSYLQFFPKAPSLYTPQNWLRLVTGTGLGIGMGAMLLPVFNQTVWKDWSGEKLLSSWRQLFEILLIAAVVDLAVLSGNPLLLYPLAVLSALTVLVLLSMIYAMVWVMLSKSENHFQSLKGLTTVLLAGFATALCQIAVMDLGRYLLTRTWNGFFS